MKTKLTKNEIKSLYKMCEIRSVDFKLSLGNLNLYWDDKLNLNNGILGKFSIPNNICLPLWYKEQNDFNLNKITDCKDFEDIAITIGHEIYHCYQYVNLCKKFGLFGPIVYLFLACRIWSEWTVEIGAEKESIRIGTILNKSNFDYDED